MYELWTRTLGPHIRGEAGRLRRTDGGDGGEGEGGINGDLERVQVPPNNSHWS